MSNLKKILCLLIAIMLCLTGFPLTAFASSDCSHSSVEKLRLHSDSAKQIDGNEYQHSVTNYYQIKCTTCKEVLDYDYEETVLQSHSYNSRKTCTKCGYVTTGCTHKSVKKTLVDTYYTDNGDGKKHTKVQVYSVTCRSCNGLLNDCEEQKSTKSHTLNAQKICKYCEFDLIQSCNHTKTQKRQIKSYKEEIDGDSQYHNLVKVYKVTCSSCNTVVDSEQEERTAQKHSLNSKKICACGFNAATNCTHQQTKKTKINLYKEEINGDSEYHNLVNIYKVTCSLCNTVVDSGREERTAQMHSLNSKKVCVCGFNAATNCTHQQTKKTQIKYEIQKIDGDKTNHAYVRTYKVTCRTCNKVVDNAYQESTPQKHTLNSKKICTKCKMDTSASMCEHLVHNNDTYLRTDYDNINDANIHMMQHIWTHWCSDCGISLPEFGSEWIEEVHNFDGNVCTKCKYVQQTAEPIQPEKEEEEEEKGDTHEHNITQNGYCECGYMDISNYYSWTGYNRSSDRTVVYQTPKSIKYYGEIFADERVKVIGEIDGYYYIEYSTSTGTKRGYIPDNVLYRTYSYNGKTLKIYDFAGGKKDYANIKEFVQLLGGSYSQNFSKGTIFCKNSETNNGVVIETDFRNAAEGNGVSFLVKDMTGKQLGYILAAMYAGVHYIKTDSFLEFYSDIDFQEELDVENIDVSTADINKTWQVLNTYFKTSGGGLHPYIGVDTDYQFEAFVQEYQNSQKLRAAVAATETMDNTFGFMGDLINAAFNLDPQKLPIVKMLDTDAKAAKIIIDYLSSYDFSDKAQTMENMEIVVENGEDISEFLDSLLSVLDKSGTIITDANIKAAQNKLKLLEDKYRYSLEYNRVWDDSGLWDSIKTVLPKSNYQKINFSSDDLVKILNDVPVKVSVKSGTSVTYKLGKIYNIDENSVGEIAEFIQNQFASSAKHERVFDVLSNEISEYLKDEFVLNLNTYTSSKYGKKIRNKVITEIKDAKKKVEKQTEAVELENKNNYNKQGLLQIGTTAVSAALSAIGAYNQYYKYGLILDEFETELRNILIYSGCANADTIIDTVMDTLMDTVVKGSFVVVSEAITQTVATAVIEDMIEFQLKETLEKAISKVATEIFDKSVNPMLMAFEISFGIASFLGNYSSVHLEVWAVEDLYRDFLEIKNDLNSQAKMFHNNPTKQNYVKLYYTARYYALVVRALSKKVSDILVADAQSAKSQVINYFKMLFSQTGVDLRLNSIEENKKIPVYDGNKLDTFMSTLFPNKKCSELW